MSDRCPRCGSAGPPGPGGRRNYECGSAPPFGVFHGFQQSYKCRIRQLEGLLRECAALVFLPDAVKDKIEKTLEEK